MQLRSNSRKFCFANIGVELHFPQMMDGPKDCVHRLRQLVALEIELSMHVSSLH